MINTSRTCAYKCQLYLHQPENGSPFRYHIRQRRRANKNSLNSITYAVCAQPKTIVGLMCRRSLWAIHEHAQVRIYTLKTNNLRMSMCYSHLSLFKMNAKDFLYSTLQFCLENIQFVARHTFWLFFEWLYSEVKSFAML